MASGKQLLSIVFAGIIFFALLVAGYFLYHELKIPIRPAIHAVPANTFIFCKITDPGIFFEKLSANEMAGDLRKIEEIGIFFKQAAYLDSLINLDKSVGDLFLQNPVYISVNPIKDGSSPGFLFIAGTSNASEYRTLKNFFKLHFKDYSTKEKHAVGRKESAITKINGTRPFYYAFRDGIFTGSFELSLVVASLVQLDSGKPISDLAGLDKLLISAGKKVDANIYFNYRGLQSFTEDIFNEKRFPGTNLNSFAGWTELDLLLKPDELLMNGYTWTPDSTGYFLDLFIAQVPQKTACQAILPFNTSYIGWSGISDETSFFRNYHPLPYYYTNESADSLISDPASQLVNLSGCFYPWIGSEMGTATTQSDWKNATRTRYAFFREKSGTYALPFLAGISDTSGYKPYNGYPVRQLLKTDLLQHLFGPSFAGFGKAVYTRIKDYIVFAPTQADLQVFLDAYISGKTLDKNRNYNAFSANIPDKSSLSFYVDLHKYLGDIGSFVHEPLKSFLVKHENILGNFEALSIQFSPVNDVFYTNLYLRYNPVYRPENLAAWETVLDAGISRGPFLIRNANADTAIIIVFDKQNNMYRVDTEGRIRWKIQVDGPVLSDVFPVNIGRNGTIYMLFNTATSIYMIDEKGNPGPSFPVRLETGASTGMAVAESGKNNDHTLLIPLEDKTVCNLDIKGEKVKRWKNPQSGDIVRTPPQILKKGNKEFIFVTDLSGDLQVFGSKGKTEFQVHDKFRKSINSAIYINQTNSKGTFITTDEKGHLVYLSEKGTVQSTVFKECSPDHYFIYEDFDGNGQKDFIFADQNNVSVYDKFKKVLFTYEFPSRVSYKPVFIRISKQEKLMGIVCADIQQLFIVDQHGKMMNTMGFRSETPIISGSLGKDRVNILSGAGNTLFNYVLK